MDEKIVAAKVATAGEYPAAITFLAYTERCSDSGSESKKILGKGEKSAVI
jgi:hypothetical protein